MPSGSDPSLTDRTRSVVSRLGVVLAPERLAAVHPEANSLEPDRFAELVLTTACVEGDPAAVAAFIHGYEPQVSRIATNSLPEDAHDDFVQAVIAGLVVGGDTSPPGLHHFAGKGTLRGFIRMTASRRAIDHLRKIETASTRARSLEGIMLPPRSPEESLTDSEAKQQFSATLGAVLGSLRPKERRALRMRYLLGFSLAKTASALQMHEGSVSRLVSRLRAEIHNEMVTRMRASGGSTVKNLLTTLDVSIGQWLTSNLADE